MVKARFDHLFCNLESTSGLFIKMNKHITVKTPEQNEFIKTLQKMAYEHNAYDIFCDFLTLSCYAFANVSHFNQDRENKYLSIIGKYKKDVQEQFPKLLAIVTEGFQRGFCDFLGDVYMACDFGSDSMGQFFTPYSVCQVCAEMNVPKDIDTNRIYKVAEPACGGGAMIIALAEVFYKRGLNFQHNMYVEMTDLSWNAVCMSMIQMSLLGIPATIIHGNTLSLEIFDVFETPMVGMNLIKERIRIQEKEDKVQPEEKKQVKEIKLNTPLFDME